MRFVTGYLAFLACTASEEDEKVVEQQGVREMLEFVELNQMNLLEYGDYPAIYNSSYPRIEECGCYYSPRKIMWGSKIGLECQRGITGTAIEDLPEFDSEKCGITCNDMHGFDTVLFCPPGWEASCQSGCLPTAKFDTVEDRVDFWDKTTAAFLLYGADYISIQADHLDECGCTTKARQILYGSKIGFDCIMGEDAEFKPGCSASSNCLDSAGRRIVTFCPAGHRSTCDGCEKDLESNDIIDRLEWMVAVTSGIVQLSLPMLNWQPSMEQLLGCACKGGVEPITYGAKVGVVCEVHSIDLIEETCGPNRLCVDGEDRNILHICPRGYSPSCTLGCASPIVKKQKIEL